MNSTSSITQVISLLTTPLLMKSAPKTIATLRTILRANLVSIIPASGNINLHFRLSPSVLPPAPILATCIGSGVTWAEWSRALGGQSFDVYVTNTTVSIKLAIHDRPLTVWRAAQENKDDVFVPPISKTQHREVGVIAKRLLVRPATIASTKAHVVRIPQLPRERKPSKLSQSFSPLEESDEESDSDCSDVSRPSSRLSTFSFGSSVDSDGSLTSVSTASSPVSSPPVSAKPKMVHPSPPRSLPVVNGTKKTTTSYLYQGGSTNVMTGGVMLGKATTGTLRSKPAPVAPIAKASSMERPTLSWRRRL